MEYYFTMKDQRKIEIIRQVVNKEIRGVEAAIILGYTKVHVSRLKQKYIKMGESKPY